MSLNRFRLGRLFPIVCLITVAAVAGCASSTVLQSQPPGARVFLNGVPVGTTPYTMTDTNISGTATQVRLEYPGFDPFNAMIVRSEELDPLALIGGIFLLVPLLWIMGYQPIAHVRDAAPRRGAAARAAVVDAAAAAGRLPAGAAAAGRLSAAAARRLSRRPPATRRPSRQLDRGCSRVGSLSRPITPPLRPYRLR